MDSRSFSCDWSTLHVSKLTRLHCALLLGAVGIRLSVCVQLLMFLLIYVCLSVCVQLLMFLLINNVLPMSNYQGLSLAAVGVIGSGAKK